MYQSKVNNTQQYSDSQGEHVVCKGKLVLINRNIESDSLLTESVIGYISKREGDIIYDNIGLDPIIISETEEIKEDDYIYSSEGFSSVDINIKGITVDLKETNDAPIYSLNKSDLIHKVLALPEHFSDKHLQAIVDGKIKDGDIVYLKVDEITSPHHNGQGKTDYLHEYNQIDLKGDNHITLFPAKQSLEEAAFEYEGRLHRKTGLNVYSDDYIRKAFRDGVEWAKKNNY